MSHLAPVFLLLVLTSCLAGPPPPAPSAPSGTSTSSGSCDQFKIKTPSDFDDCKAKCKDQQRDQQKSCTGAGCQAGALMGPCFGSCDDGQKAAKQASCYKDK